MTRRQHNLFAHKYLRDLFHQNPFLLFEHMRSDAGASYVAQIWQDTAEAFGLDVLDTVDAAGLNIDYREAADYGLVVILLPAPKLSPEACFIGIWANYSDAYTGKNPFRYFTLELKEDIDPNRHRLDESETYFFCEWAADSQHLNYGDTGPTLSGFVRAIEALVFPQASSTPALSSTLSPLGQPEVSREPEPNTPAKGPAFQTVVSENDKSLNELQRSQIAEPGGELISQASVKKLMAQRRLSKASKLHANHSVDTSPLNLDMEKDHTGNQNSTAILFEGTFKPPTISIQIPPVKVAGKGSCEIMSDGLKVQGFKQTPQMSGGLLAASFLIIFFIGNFIGGIIGWSMKAAGVGLLYSASQGKGTDHKGEKIDLFIPWENIEKANLSKASNLITVQVKNFRFQEKYHKKGALFFHTSSNPDGLLNAVMNQCC
jgi:hypothetical protein